MKRKLTKRIRVRSCSDVVDYICDNLDGGLKSKKCLEIKRHLAHCPNCTAYLDGLKKTVYLYKRYRDPKLPGKHRQKLHAILKLRNS